MVQRVLYKLVIVTILHVEFLHLVQFHVGVGIILLQIYAMVKVVHPQAAIILTHKVIIP